VTQEPTPVRDVDSRDDDHVLAVDLGTGGPKVALLTATGHLVSHAFEPVGMSLLPGGGAGPDASPLEKVYVVLNGRLTVQVYDVVSELGPLDSCTIGPDTVRHIVIVIMPYAPS